MALMAGSTAPGTCTRNFLREIPTLHRSSLTNGRSKSGKRLAWHLGRLLYDQLSTVNCRKGFASLNLNAKAASIITQKRKYVSTVNRWRGDTDLPRSERAARLLALSNSDSIGKKS